MLGASIGYFAGEHNCICRPGLSNECQGDLPPVRRPVLHLISNKQHTLSSCNKADVQLGGRASYFTLASPTSCLSASCPR